jgi:hypothetical protein
LAVASLVLLPTGLVEKRRNLWFVLFTVECWFQGDLVFEELKEKSKQLLGLGNRKSLFWVRSYVAASSL